MYAIGFSPRLSSEMRNFLITAVTVLLLAGSYSSAYAQDEPKYLLWMWEGRGCLEGNFGDKHRDEAITWFRRVKRRCFFNKNIRGQAMRGISEYQLYKSDTLAAVKTLRKVIGKRICHKIETGNAGKIRERKKEEWNRYYAACDLTALYIDKKEFAKSRLFLGYADSIVNVTWTCGTGSFGHDLWVEENILRYWIGLGRPEDAYAYRYGQFGLYNMLPTDLEHLDGFYMLSDNNMLPRTTGLFTPRAGKADSLIYKTLLSRYNKEKLRNAFDNMAQNIHSQDTVIASGRKIRMYYGNFLGKQIRLTAWFSDEKGTPITPAEDQKYRKEAEALVYHSWIYKELEK